jgi:hypothetical protein
MQRYQFKVRTRTGLVVENLVVQAADRAAADRRLLQMYRGGEILECIEQSTASRDESADLAGILSMITRQGDPPTR